MDKKMETIRKLLAKAERAGTPEEAETFRAKATELMVRYSIDEALLGAKHESTDRVGSRRFVIKGYAKPKSILLSVIAHAFGGQTVRLMSESTYGTAVCMVYAWESDLAMIEVLYASLEMQALREIDPAHRETPWVNKMAFTTSFLVGFAATVSKRLEAQKKRAVADTGGTGTELVLVDRSKAVADQVAAEQGRLRKGKAATTSTATGWRSGNAAGARADLGQGGLGGSRRAIGGAR